MTINIEQLRQDLASESKRFLLQVISVGAACFAAGVGAAVAYANYERLTPPTAALPATTQPTLTLTYPPGTVITIPPAPAAKP